MRELMVPVDGSVVADRATPYAIELACRMKDTRIVLINVRQTLDRWYTHGLLNEEALKQLKQQGEAESAKALAPRCSGRLL